MQVEVTLSLDGLQCLRGVLSTMGHLWHCCLGRDLTGCCCLSRKTVVENLMKPCSGLAKLSLTSSRNPTDCSFRGFNYPNYSNKLIITTQDCPEVAFMLSKKGHKTFPAQSSCLFFHGLRKRFLIVRRVCQLYFFLVLLVFFLWPEAFHSLILSTSPIPAPPLFNTRLEAI